MWHRSGTRLALASVLMILSGVAVIAVEKPTTDPAAVDKAFETLKTYDWGNQRSLLKPIDDAVVATHGDAAARKQLESRLAAVLTTGASRDAKDYVCRKLTVIGTAQSVPTLAGLLPDKDLSHMARFALERMPAPEAAQALRDALPKLNGALKVGAISSLGARRDVGSVPALAALLGDETSIASAAACALGDIGTPEAADTLEKSMKTATAAMKPAIADARLVCAERLLADGRKTDALAIYRPLNVQDQSKYVRLAAIVGLCDVQSAASGTSDEVMQMITNLVRETDRDMRAAGLQQVREKAKGAAATTQFAALLPTLPPDAQAGLLAALADRGDRTARPAVLEMLKSREEPVCAAAARALGSLGETADVPLLAELLSAKAEAVRTAARSSLTRLAGPDVHAAIVAELEKATPQGCVELLGVLGARRATDTIPAMLEAARDAHAEVRVAAMAVLGKLAAPEHVADMVQRVLYAEPGPERQAAETAVLLVCKRIDDASRWADLALPAWEKQNDYDKMLLLPTLGRLGGPTALKLVEAAIADKDPERHQTGIQALCNWPDATVTERLADLAPTAGDANQRILILRALIRVAALPDTRSNADRLKWLMKAMTMATRDEERNMVVKRVRAVRTVESLRFVVPYLDQPAFAQEACATVVELAHHRELREPNKAEFDKALDAVIRTSQDADAVDRAKRYKKGQT